MENPVLIEKLDGFVWFVKNDGTGYPFKLHPSLRPVKRDQIFIATEQITGTIKDKRETFVSAIVDVRTPTQHELYKWFSEHPADARLYGFNI